MRDIGDIVDPLGERPIAVITLTASSSAGVNSPVNMPPRQQCPAPSELFGGSIDNRYYVRSDCIALVCNGFRRESVRSSWWGFQPGASAVGVGPLCSRSSRKRRSSRSRRSGDSGWVLSGGLLVFLLYLVAFSSRFFLLLLVGGLLTHSRHHQPTVDMRVVGPPTRTLGVLTVQAKMRRTGRAALRVDQAMEGAAPLVALRNGDPRKAEPTRAGDEAARYGDSRLQRHREDARPFWLVTIC